MEVEGQRDSDKRYDGNTEVNVNTAALHNYRSRRRLANGAAPAGQRASRRCC